MKWLGQHIVSLIARFRNSVFFESVENATGDTDKFLVINNNSKLKYRTGAEVLSDIGAGDITGVSITTDSGVEERAQDVDGTADFNLVGSNGVGITNSGTDITAVAVPGEIDHNSLLNYVAERHFTQANITTVGSIGTGIWQGTAIDSDYLDADTAHLSGTQSFTGAKTFSTQIVANGGLTSSKTIFYDGNGTIPALGDGTAIHVDASDITDAVTSASGTAAKYTHVNIEPPRLLATNASVTTTDAATLYISGPPVASTNQTITRAHSLWVDSGNVRFDGALTVDGTITGDVTGDVSGQAGTVATIAGLAPNTATTQATQGNITSCANLATVGTIGTGVWNGTKITDVYTNSSGKRYGNTIKILPGDWMINDDAASPLSFKDGSNSGVMVNDSSSEMIALVTIPEGMKATALDIYSTNNKAVSIYELDLDSSFDFSGSGPGAKETGNANTQITIDPAINATDKNVLAITYQATATSNRIWGGLLTIAPQ